MSGLIIWCCLLQDTQGPHWMPLIEGWNAPSTTHPCFLIEVAM